MFTNFGKGHDGKITNACKNRHLGSIFKPGKYVLMVCFENDIQPKIQVPTPVDAVLQNNFSVAINNLRQKICDNHSLT